MKKLLSLPPSVVRDFHDITGLSREEYFCTADPSGRKLGSGGGTAWLLESAYGTAAPPNMPFEEWLQQEKRILVHAGGQSRRLPAYATSGKSLTPIPVFRWARGQKIDQVLLDLQVPFYESILRMAPKSMHTLVASGDVLLRATQPLQSIPDVDVVCYGFWADAEEASRHGVFFMNRESPDELDFMLQKPSAEEQARLMATHYSLMDIGVWLLSDRAVEILRRKCRGLQADANVALPEAGADAASAAQSLQFYDLYSAFGGGLGKHPSKADADLAELSVAVLPLPGGEFYHFGTTSELLTSLAAIQNLVKDQRIIIQKKVRMQNTVFTQNAIVERQPDANSEFVWIENSHVPTTWHYSRRNVITGVPRNNWVVNLPEGVCIDIVPVGETQYCLRPYGFDDSFRGAFLNASTRFLGGSLRAWLQARGISAKEKDGDTTDIQEAPIFPVLDSVAAIGRWIGWMIAEKPSRLLTEDYLRLPKLSADQIAERVNLRRLAAQRREFLREDLAKLARNWRKSVFFQTDLEHTAAKYAELGLPLPAPLPADAPLPTRQLDAAFRGDDQKAFALLRDSLIQPALMKKCHPRRSTKADQIVWGRSPVRIDVAGGWTDTPPYALHTGGNVVNMAVELNGQPPLQVYVKPSKEPVIICRSIDLGAMERIETYDELRSYDKVGSPFSIPKAALSLAGFLPEFGEDNYSSLRQQLEHFGSGIEITLLSAIPAGSGMGTSSILAATVLGAVSDFCTLDWDKYEICARTLMLEQLLTTGGGWQDQYGGVLPGVKLLQTSAGFEQNVMARWLPETLFSDPLYAPCHLLYYTGLTRTAKGILADIVRGMFLNSSSRLSLLDEMRSHALTLFDAVQRGNFEEYGRLVGTSWAYNKALDAGTNPPTVEQLCSRVHDLCLGYKLPGAGGGGFLYMVAKDAEAAGRIRRMLNATPLTPNSRFVEMSISHTGLKVSRS